MCDYGVYNCCRKKLVDLAGDPDPAGKGNFAADHAAVVERVLVNFLPAFGSICENDENIGRSTCSWSQVCCVPKTNVGVGGSNPTANNVGVGGSGPAANNVGVGGSGSAAATTTGTGAADSSVHPVLALVQPAGWFPALTIARFAIWSSGSKIFSIICSITVLFPALHAGYVVSGVLYMVSSGSKGLTGESQNGSHLFSHRLYHRADRLADGELRDAHSRFKNPLGGSWV